MGDTAEMMINGILCEGCGEFLNENPTGYPCYCSLCNADEDEDEDNLFLSFAHFVRAEDFLTAHLENDDSNHKLINILDEMRVLMKKLESVVNTTGDK